jgi:LPXTG-motif cell wall-anchored protein
MFKNKKAIYGLVGFLVVLAILSFTFNNLSNNKQTAFARQADVILTAPAGVPNNSTTPVSVYFSYGNPNGDLDIVNAIASLSLSNSNFTIVPSSIQDLYFGSPLRSDAQNPPAQPTCNSSYTGPVYALSSSLATTSSMTYGLQSARNSSAASGTATAGPLPSGANGLREKATGCIKVDFLVTPNVSGGSTTVVTFDEDSTLSVSYQENRRPGRQIVTLSAVGPLSTANTTATAGTATSTATSGTATSTSGTATSTAGTATSTATAGTATSTATSGTATSTATSGTATATSGTATSTAGTATSTATSGTATSTATSTAGTATATATSGTATSTATAGTATSTATSGTATSTSTTTSGTATSTSTSGTATSTATTGATTGATTSATTATSSGTGTTTTPRTGGNSIVLSILGISAAMISGIAFYYSRKSKLSKKINISK